MAIGTSSGINIFKIVLSLFDNFLCANLKENRIYQKTFCVCRKCQPKDGNFCKWLNSGQEVFCVQFYLFFAYGKCHRIS